MMNNFVSNVIYFCLLYFLFLLSMYYFLLLFCDKYFVIVQYESRWMTVAICAVDKNFKKFKINRRTKINFYYREGFVFFSFYYLFNFVGDFIGKLSTLERKLHSKNKRSSKQRLREVKTSM